MAKGRPQIVRDGIAEGFEFLVRRLEQFAPTSQFCRDPTPLRDVVMNQMVHRGEQDELQQCPEDKEHDRVSRTPRRLYDTASKSLLLRRFQVDDHPMDGLNLKFCCSREGDGANAFIAIGLSGGNGGRLGVELLTD